MKIAHRYLSKAPARAVGRVGKVGNGMTQHLATIEIMWLLARPCYLDLVE